MWILKPEERLREWKSFRQKISQLPIEQACQEVTHLWSYAPYFNHYLDPDQKNSHVPWPDPWTLLYENCYCDLAKSLGMLYTLYLSDHRPQDIELIVALDTASRQTYNLVKLCKGKYILNFMFDTVVNKKQLPTTLSTNYQYTAQDLNLDIY
jgi:hypothetical protein